MYSLQNLANFSTFWQFWHPITLQWIFRTPIYLVLPAQLQAYNDFEKNQLLRAIYYVMALIQNLRFVQFCYFGLLVLILIKSATLQGKKIWPSNFQNFLISMSYNHSRNLKEFKIFDLTLIVWSTMEQPSGVKIREKHLTGEKFTNFIKSSWWPWFKLRENFLTFGLLACWKIAFLHFKGKLTLVKHQNENKSSLKSIKQGRTYALLWFSNCYWVHKNWHPNFDSLN